MFLFEAWKKNTPLSVVVYYCFTVWVSVLGPLNADANATKLSLHLDQTLQSPPRA